MVIRHGVSDQWLGYIGDMTVSFAVLESFMQHLFGSLVYEGENDINFEAGDMIAAEYSSKKLRAVLVSVYRIRHGEDSDYKILRRLIVRAAKVDQERNQITHSVWGMDPTNLSVIIRLKRISRETRGYDIQREEYDAKKFEDFIEQIMTLCRDFMFLELHLGESSKIASRPWPGGFPDGLPSGLAGKAQG
jgi:hypothetical protein